ncbi:hypothetical protein NDU88_006941 [Pleurodeles waltl]|uniref:Uncharacterized protein n=1 Tax=Pleurodeles waltl TaxID=8319 RepID=A0AAV7QJ72_PLEWA|nr:hypothetical protein NDU88_006941 [Pleurodeles waltl]
MCPNHARFDINNNLTVFEQNSSGTLHLNLRSGNYHFLKELIRAVTRLQAALAAHDERRRLHAMSCSLKNTDTGSHIADISRAVARLQNQLPWLHAMSNGGFTR